MGEQQGIDLSSTALSGYRENKWSKGGQAYRNPEDAPQTERAARLDLLRHKYDNLRLGLLIPPALFTQKSDAEKPGGEEISGGMAGTTVVSIPEFNRAGEALKKAEEAIIRMRQAWEEANRIVNEK